MQFVVSFAKNPSVVALKTSISVNRKERKVERKEREEIEIEVEVEVEVETYGNIEIPLRTLRKNLVSLRLKNHSIGYTIKTLIKPF